MMAKLLFGLKVIMNSKEEKLRYKGKDFPKADETVIKDAGTTEMNQRLDNRLECQ
jgi:hypothetical protein